MSTKFHSNGKLLLSGEYLVLDGAKALALPTTYGQSLVVSENETNNIAWKSLDHNRQLWYEDSFDLENERIKSTQNNEISKKLCQILQYGFRQNTDARSRNKGYEISTKLEFPQNWGLGSSSTLINNIANWLKIDPYRLLENSFGGSGYDIACAQNDQPISFQLEDDKRIVVREDFDPPFKKQLFFVHLKQKQNSREAIAHYRKQAQNQRSKMVHLISQISDEITNCNDLPTFEKLLTEHEKIISSAVNIIPVKKQFFKDYPNALKSLGGWGGDFILAVGGENEKGYFRKKGFFTILDYEKMVLNNPTPNFPKK